MSQIPAIPAAHNTVNPFVIVSDAAGFIDFVTEVFDGRESPGLRIPDRDGSLIHAEVVIGDSSVLISDRKSDWPFTPAFLQVYVPDSQEVLDRAVERGGTVVTPVSSFYGGFTLSRLQDPWGNLWWLYSPAPAVEPGPTASGGSTDWHDRKPSAVYTTLMEAMRRLGEPTSGDLA
ncbi:MULTISPECIES: VOC family protein [Arthrobacter]|uniref:VOC family protein n=2 Tax=Arthrobacter TaxID=1663 RepID=A0ABU9KQ89_9MICC|nr:VOC family protein [Arthrobacter sp. YJM1]MDP5228279.1 glyoxalase [Arthrobacter sp. YJM1]